MSDRHEESMPERLPAANAVPDELEPRPRTSRRDFLGQAGRRALYIAPAVLTLSAQHAAAASNAECGSNFKRTIGSPCATDGSQKDCCPTDMLGNPIECHTHLDGTTMTCQEPGSPL